MSSPTTNFPKHKNKAEEILSCLDQIQASTRKTVEQIKQWEADKNFTGELSPELGDDFQEEIKHCRNHITSFINLNKFQKQDFDLSSVENMKKLFEFYEQLNFFLNIQIYFVQLKKWQHVFGFQKNQCPSYYSTFFTEQASVMRHFRSDLERSIYNLFSEPESIEEMNSILNNNFSPLMKRCEDACFYINLMKKELTRPFVQKIKKTYPMHVVSGKMVLVIFLFTVLISLLMLPLYSLLFTPPWQYLFLALFFIVVLARCLSVYFSHIHSLNEKILKKQEEEKKAEEEQVGEIRNDLISQIQTALLFVMAVDSGVIALEQIEGESGLLNLIDELCLLPLMDQLQTVFADDYIVMIHELLIEMQGMISSKQCNALQKKFHAWVQSDDDQSIFQENLKKTIGSINITIKNNKKITEHWTSFLLSKSLTEHYIKMRDIFLKPKVKITERDLLMLKILIKVGGPQFEEALLSIREILSLDKDIEFRIIKSECFEKACSIFFNDGQNNKVSPDADAQEQEEKYGQDVEVKGLDEDLELQPAWQLKTDEQLKADLAGKNRAVLIQQLNCFLDSVCEPVPASSLKRRPS